MGVGHLVIHPGHEVILIDGPFRVVNELPGAVTKVEPAGNVWQGQGVNEGFGGRADRYWSGRQDSLMGIRVGHRDDIGSGLALQHGFKVPKKEYPIPFNGASQGNSKLIAPEGSDGFIFGVKIVLGIQRRVAEKLKHAAVKRVGPTAGHEINDPAEGRAIFRAVVAGQETEFLDGLDPQAVAAHAGRGSGGVIIPDASIEQEQVLRRPLPLYDQVQTRSPGYVSDVIVVGDDPRLKRRQLSVAAAIQRQVPHGAFIHQVGDGGIRSLDQRGFPRHLHSLRNGAHL